MLLTIAKKVIPMAVPGARGEAVVASSTSSARTRAEKRNKEAEMYDAIGKRIFERLLRKCNV